MAWSTCFKALALVLAALPPQSSATEVAPHEGAFDELMAWMQEGIDKYVAEEHRSELLPLRETLTTRDRTFVAKRDLQKGELLLRLPREYLINDGYFRGEDSPYATSLKKADELEGTDKDAYLRTFQDISNDVWQALYLVAQRRLGPRSFWHEYIKLLPSEFPGNPVFYTEKDFSLLQGSSFLPRARSLLGVWTKMYQDVSQSVQGFNFSLEEYFWACSAADSRKFGTENLMVPVGDMFNHRSPMQLEAIYNKTSNAFDMWVTEDVAAGGELFFSYGVIPNDRLLSQFFFAVPNLPKRLLHVQVALVLDGVPDHEAKQKWLTEALSLHRKHEVSFTLRLTWEKDINLAGPSKMLAHARLLELSDMKEVERQILPEMKNCKGIPRQTEAPSVTVPLCPNPVSIPNEQSALRRCLRVIRKALKAYPTTLKDDKRLLRNLEGVPASLVTLVRDEKVVLVWWESFFGLALDVLDLGSGRSIEKRCIEVLGETKCSVKSNYYMNTTLHELLEGDSTTNPGVLRSPVPWLILVLMVAAVVWWRTGCVGGSATSAPPGRKEKKAKRA